MMRRTISSVRSTTRGQAALEFLSTYGFAFLLILVMIGALSYFGILNPQRLIPDRCVSTSEFSCYDNIVNIGDGTGEFTLILFNNLGSPITLDAVAVNVPEFATAGTCDSNPAIGDSIPSGARFTIACTTLGIISGDVATGQKIKVEFNFDYSQPGKFAKSSGGEVLATVQP